MSKFIDSVEATMVYGVRPIAKPLHVTHSSDAKITSNYYTTNRHTFTVAWRAEHFCKSDDVPQLMRLVKQDMRRAIYGDFIEELRKLELAFWEYDHDAMRTAINALTKKVLG